MDLYYSTLILYYSYSLLKIIKGNYAYMKYSNDTRHWYKNKIKQWYSLLKLHWNREKKRKEKRETQIFTFYFT